MALAFKKIFILKEILNKKKQIEILNTSNLGMRY